MQIPQIRMQSQFAQIGMESRPASQSIQQPLADLQIRQPQATMTMRTIPGKLTIDQTQAWEEMGIKSAFRSIEENARKGNQAVLQGIARVAREGDEKLNIHSGRNIIVEQARRKSQQPPAETNIAFIPSPFAVKMHYQPGKTDIRFQENKPMIDATIRKPIINHQQGDVNIYLKQRNYLKIDLVK